MLSRRSRSAIAAMLEVARLARGRPLPARALTAQNGIAPRQFEAVLQALVRAGLLRSLRGPHGGYELARERRRISVGAIVRAVEDGREPEALPGSVAALIAPMVERAGAAFLAELDAVSIEDLCRAQQPGEAATDVDFTI